MGLDMYLTAKQYLSSYKPEDAAKRAEIKKLFPEFADTDVEAEEVSFSVMYWRKANHVHKWFVENVQDGKDDCRSYYVSMDQLAELCNLCKNVLDHKANVAELMPTASGFFFGGTEYDEYYFEKTKDTYESLQKIINNPALAKHNFYYSSSW